MTNFDIAEEVADTSANRSQGSAQKELANFQKGIEYSLGQFRASFQELSTDFITSDLVKGVVDFGTQLVNVLDLTIGKFGALKTAIAGVGLTLFLKDIGGVKSALTSFIKQFTLYQQGLGTTDALSIGFEALAAKIGVTTVALGSFIAIAAGLVTVAAILSKIHVSADEALDSFTKQKDSFDNAKMEVDDLNAQLEETQSKINALEAKGNLSLVEQEDLNNLKIQNERLEKTLQLREAELKLEARKTGSEAHKLYNEWTTEDGLLKNGKSNSYNADRIANKVDQDWVAKDIVAGLIYGNAGGEARAKSMTDDFNAEANKDNINELIAAYKSYQKILSEIDNAEATLGEDQVELRKKLEESRVEIEGKALDVQDYIDGYASVMSYVKEAYTQMQESGISLTDVQQSELIEAQKFLNEYNNMITDAAKNIEQTIEDILDNDKFKNVFAEMAEKYSSGQTDAMRKVIEDNKGLMEELLKSGITPEQLVSYVANKIDPDKLDFRAVRDQLKKYLGEGIESLSDEEIEILYRYVNAGNVTLEELTPDDLEATLSLAIEVSGGVNVDQVAESFNNATSNSKTLLDTIGSINSALNSQKTGEALSPETYSSDDLLEYRDALEAVDGTMQYNIDKVKALNKAKVEEQIANNNAAKALEQVKWKENARELAEYRSKLADLTEGTDEYSKVQADITRLESDNDEIVNKCNYLDLYNQKLRESIGAYQAWIDAQNGGESGDMSNDVRSAMQNIKDVFDTESSEFGKVGTHKYEAAVEFLIPETVEKDKIQPYIDSLGEYFNGEKSGVDKFVQEGIDKQLFEYDPDSQQLKVAAGKTMQDFADAMMSEQGGWTMEAVQAMFGLLDDYTEGDFSFESMFKDIDESGLDNVTDSTNSAGDAAESAADSYDRLKKSVSDFKAEQAEERDGLDSTPVGKPKASASTISDLSSQSALNEKLSIKNGSTGTTTGGDEATQQTKTMEVVVHTVQDPNPLEIVTHAQDDGKIAVFAQTPDGNDVLQVQVKPTDDGKVNVSAVTPDGGEVLNVDVNPENDGVVNVSAVTPDGGNVLNIQLKPENDGKVNVSAVTPDGGEALNVNIDGKVGDITSAQSEMQATLDANPLKQEINAYYADEFTETPEVEAAEEEVNLTGNITELDTSEVEGETVSVETEDLPNETAVLNVDTDSVSEGVAEGEAIVESFDGVSATAELNAEDNGTSVVNGFKGALDSIPSEKVVHIRTESTLAGVGVHGLNGTAHAHGTAYSGGNWGAKSNTTALVGELGREIVVDPRTGKWHTVGDNGAEFTKIKRGDIVFNHKQTEELLARGFVNGRGSALAWGTAYSDGVSNQRFSDKAVGYTLGNPSTSSSNANTAAQNANTKSTKSNTKETDKNTKSTKKATDLYDWVAVRLKYFANKTKEIADQINDYISSATKTSLLSRQIAANQNEIGANQRGADLYLVQANKVAKQSKMSKKLINKAQTGAWKFEKLSDKDQKKVQEYLKYYDKYQDAQQKVRDLRNEQLELYEQWANMPAEEAAKKVEKLTNAIKLLSNAYNLASSGASALAQYAKTAASTSATNNSQAAQIARQYSNQPGYQAANALLDAQLAQTSGNVTAYQNAYNQSVANKNAAYANIGATRNAAAAARNAVTAKAQSILNTNKYAKNLSKAQKNALAAGNLVNTKGLSGKTLSQIKAYNALVSNATTQANSAADAVTKYNIATQAQEAAFQQLAESQAEYAQMVVENEKKKFDNIKNYFDLEINMEKQLADEYAKSRELQEAYGQDLTSTDFTNQIDKLNDELSKMMQQSEALDNQLKEAVSGGKIKEGSEEWLNMYNQILAINNGVKDLQKNILDLQDEMRKEVFYQAFDKALKKAEELRASVSTIRDIMTEEMMFDDDGLMTDFGITALAMDVKEYESYLDSMGELLAKRQQYIDDFNDNNNDTNYSQKEFDEDMSNITKEIQDLLRNATSARKAIIDMVSKTSKAELDAILKAIDARQKLLKKTKEWT